MKSLVFGLALSAGLFAQFEFKDVDGKTVALTENGRPVWNYNYGMMLAKGAAEDRTRCCYIHPVYSPAGVVVSDDFPQDHPHHRGINWSWPAVTVDAKTYDLWNIKGIHARYEKWLKPRGCRWQGRARDA